MAAARQVANASAIAAARNAVVTATQLPKALQRTRPMMEEAGLESILAAAVAEVDLEGWRDGIASDQGGGAAQDPRRRQATADSSKLGPLGVVPSGLSNAPLPPDVAAVAGDLSKLRPGQPLWMPSRQALGHVVSNNPFFKLVHVECQGSVVEASYDELRVAQGAASLSQSLSMAVADLEGQVRGLAHDLELAPEPVEIAKRVASAAAEPPGRPPTGPPTGPKPRGMPSHPPRRRTPLPIT